MSAAPPEITADVRRTRGALLVPAAMLLCMPLVAIQGPGNTTPMDGVNAIFMACAWLLLFMRRDRLVFPFALSFWTVMVASLASLFATTLLARALGVLLVDVYLYLWFVTLAFFLGRHCDIGKVGTIWTGVACAVAVLTLADAHLGVLGGQFSGMRRATGTFENPNMFGNYLVVSFFVAWATAAGRRPILYLALPLLFGGMRATASNGALVALLGGCAAAWAATSSFWTRRTLGILCIAGALVIAVGGVWHEEIETFAVRELSGARGEVGGAALKGASERFPIWETVFRILGESPFGVGPGNLSAVNAAMTGDYHGAHNEYLGMLAERGFLGLAGWLGVLAGIFGMLLRLRAASDLGFRPLGIVPLFGLYGALVSHSLVIELSHFRHFWMVIACIAAAATQASRVAVPTEEPAEGLDLAVAPARRPAA